ncbi:hypothetical protein Hamer_G017848 [Homarus americanus]|uniref:Uncharacterized protein n=1 Tax=Homarus americanus TaxID=6706 RepID=A0A8J5N449_HOMAM|nr:hypothetical protein Hamer_G017848 [Homarus americanus]
MKTDSAGIYLLLWRIHLQKILIFLILPSLKVTPFRLLSTSTPSTGQYLIPAFYIFLRGVIRVLLVSLLR